jgi:hypothetical protein
MGVYFSSGLSFIVLSVPSLSFFENKLSTVTFCGFGSGISKIQIPCL